MDAKQFRQNIDDTIDLMRLLDKTEEYGDCLLWTGWTNSAGHGMYKSYCCGRTLVRRDMYRLAKGDLTPGKPIATTCGETLCINPDHLIQTTTKAIGIRTGKSGVLSRKARCAKISQAMRKRSKLTMEMAREIRMSQESGPVLSKRYGVNKAVINNIKAGKIWKDYSSPFMGLIR